MRLIAATVLTMTLAAPPASAQRVVTPPDDAPLTADGAAPATASLASIGASAGQQPFSGHKKVSTRTKVIIVSTIVGVIMIRLLYPSFRPAH
jgi:hypothetical protein